MPRADPQEAAEWGLGILDIVVGSGEEGLYGSYFASPDIGCITC